MNPGRVYEERLSQAIHRCTISRRASRSSCTATTGPSPTGAASSAASRCSPAPGRGRTNQRRPQGVKVGPPRDSRSPLHGSARERNASRIARLPPDRQTALARRPPMDAAPDASVDHAFRHVPERAVGFHHTGRRGARQRQYDPGALTKKVFEDRLRSPGIGRVAGDVIGERRRGEQRRPRRVRCGSGFPSVSAARIAVTGRH